jgi:type II secretory pathway component PulF
MSVVCGGLIPVFLGGFAALYWWVPRWKMVLLSARGPVSDSERLLIIVSDVVVNYFYLVLPVILGACVGLFRVAFDAERDPSLTKK